MVTLKQNLLSPQSPAYKQFEMDYINQFKTLPPPVSLITTRRVFLVKNWQTTINNIFYVAQTIWPYSVNFVVPLITPSGSAIQNGDLSGVAAQGYNNNNPQSIFSDHVTVCIENKIYDPSYGTGPFPSIESWEQSSLDAHAIYTRYFDPVSMQNYPLLWTLEQELIKNQVNYNCQ